MISVRQYLWSPGPLWHKSYDDAFFLDSLNVDMIWDWCQTWVLHVKMIVVSER